MSKTGEVPYMKRIVEKAAKIFPNGGKTGSKLAQFAQFSVQCVEERIQKGDTAGRKDLLYYFTERQHDHPELMRPLDVHIEANSTVFDTRILKSDSQVCWK
jgi:hypothetical protein